MTARPLTPSDHLSASTGPGTRREAAPTRPLTPSDHLSASTGPGTRREAAPARPRRAARAAALAACLWTLSAAPDADARPSAAAPLTDPAHRAGLEWRPVPVATVPLQADDPWTAAPATDAKPRAVAIDRATAAVVQAASLTTLRVRIESGDRSTALRAWRRSPPPVAAPDAPPPGPTSRAAIAEPLFKLSEGTWLIEQPPGGAGEWLISAAKPVRIAVEAPAPRHAELIWEHVEAAALEWIARGGEPPPLPDLPAAALLRRELLADAAIAAALAETDPKDMSLQRAVRAWRGAAALQRIAALRPADRPTFALEAAPRALAATTAVELERARWQRAAGPRTWELQLVGPGVLWIDARQLGPDLSASLVVTREDRRLGRLDLQPPARRADPRDLAASAGPPRRLAVPLAPGAHTYRLRLAGDDTLLRVRVGRSNARLEAALRRQRVPDLLAAAHRALARSTSPRAPLVDALLALVDGRRLPALARPEGPPALTLTHTWLLAQVDEPTPPRRRALARALARDAAAAVDPALAARARAAGLDLLEKTDDPQLVRDLAGPRPAEAPAATLERIARLLDGPALPLGSAAVALYEQARARAPHDPGLRAAYREHWLEATRWAPLHADDGAAAPMQWIEPLPPDPTRAPTSTSLWTWPIGPARSFVAPTLAAAPARPALLRLYADLSAGSGPLALALDDRRWRALPLADREQLTVAVPPGEHALAVEAPTGARLWSNLPPAPASPPDARLLRLWPLAPASSLRFVLPGQPSFARVEVRALDASAPRRAHLTVKTDTGEARDVALDLLPADDGAVGLAGAPRLGPAASLIVPLDPQARALELSLPAGGPPLAVTAAIRAPGARPAAPPAAPAGADPKDSPEADPQQLHAAALRTVEATSRDLLAAPDDPVLRLTRAEALLDLGQRSLALTDWSRLVARPLPPALRARAATFAARLDALVAPTHLELVTDGPALVAPALAAAGLDDAALARLAPIADQARDAGPRAALQALGEPPPDRLARLSPGPAASAGAIDLAWGEAPRSAAEAISGDMSSGSYRSIRTVSATTTAPPRSPAAAIPPHLSRTPAPSRAPAPSSAPSAPRTVAHVTAPAGPAPVSPGMSSTRALDPAGEALRASLLDAAGRPDEAARAWARVYAATGRWQVGLAGVTSALAALDEPATGADGSALAYGLALQVRPTVRTPALDRLTAIAGERSRWSRLILSERGSSQETRDLPARPEPPTPRASVRAALLAPPWPLGRAAVLRPGAAATIDLDRGARTLTFDLWCQVVRPDLGRGDATVRLSIGEELLLERPVPPDSPERAAVAVPDTDSVTVALDAANQGHLCAARLRDDQARAPAGPARGHVVRPARPVEFAVLGPTTLEIEAHALRAGEARRLDVTLARGDGGGFAPRTTIALPTEPDPGAMPVKTSAPGRRATLVLTLAEAGPLRVRLAPDAGAAVVRLRQRLDDEPAPAPPRPPVRAAAPTEPVLPDITAARPAPRLPPAAPRVQRIGSPYAALHFGTDDLEEVDDLRPRISGIVRLGFARELARNRLWIAAEPELRPREDTALVAGGRLTLQAAFPRAGLRARLSGLGLVQTDADRPWSLRGDLRLDRPTWIAPRLQLLPGLEVAARHQSLADVPQDERRDLHPRVYQFYVDRHPLALRPTLDLRLALWQDARAVVGADVVANSDLRSLDQVNVHAGIAGVPILLGRLVPEFVLDYEASVRLRDADRDRTYVRHRILAGLGLGVWLKDRARIAFGVRNALYLSAPFPARNGLDLWLRVDLPFGRGLRDHGPFDMPFRAAREHRLWR